MAETISIDFARPFPLFPLPNCVLLPHVTIPLHVFETRYRQMVNDVLDSRGLIAMAVFKGNAWKYQYEGTPPLWPHLCVGYVVRHEQLADGRFNILLQGVCRARITRELEQTDKPYREAVLEPVETEDLMEIDLDDHRRQIESLLQDPMLKQLAAIHAVERWLSPELSTAAVIDLSIMTICDDMDGRYDMLAEGRITRRARWLEEYLQSTRRTLKIASRFEPLPRDDDLCLN